MRQATLAWSYVVTEYERGWGSRPDGYVSFASKAAAEAFFEKDMESRDAKHVPDYYVTYTELAERPVSSALAEKLAMKKPIYHE